VKTANSFLGNPVWDLCGFAIGLWLAWALDWQTRDLVWGLWLSSLVIGYASIVYGLGVFWRHPNRGWRTGIHANRLRE
jgi:hypothetical protein